MKKKLLLLLLLSFLTPNLFAQIKGKVSDAEGNPLPFVNIYIENTYIGTVSNEYGFYEIDYTQNGDVAVIFQYLGYKTKKEIVTLSKSQPYTLDVLLEEENYILKGVEVTNEKDPAYPIIRKAIAAKTKNAEKTDKFEANFYSKGIFRVKNLPEKILGQEIGDLDGSIDSTRSGVIYLSETVSKIKFEKPDNLKEEIIASKVAGDDKGFSYNTALNTNYDFYKNYVEFGANMISPIADNAFAYYKYQLENAFYDNQNQLINKIKVLPKRDKEPVFEGYIYIVESTWAIYAVDFDIKGYRMQQPLIETLKLTQNYSYNADNNLWAKNVQTIGFDAGIFGIKFSGKFTHVFSNYLFKDKFDKNTFTKEIVSFAENSNKKDSLYWASHRQVPLTDEEVHNYYKKDSIQNVRTSKVYLDSIDQKNNKFKPLDVIMGYTYNNSYKNWRFNYKGLSDFTSINFNTVQGWNLDSGFSFTKSDEEKGKYTAISSTFNYGLSEDRLRVNGRFFHRFNSINYAYILANGGSDISQFNNAEPISGLVNTISTLFFKDNYIKLYNKEFVDAIYGQEITNGIFIAGKLEYEKRKPLFNTTDYTVIKNDDPYLSNNPLEPFNYTNASFETHYIMKAGISTRIRFNQKYMSRPNEKFNISDSDYPEIRLNYTKAFAASEKQYQYDEIDARIDYSHTFGNKGELAVRLKGGKFFNADAIAFMDYKHFNGNQTHVAFLSDYLNNFKLLPYYTHSTNDAYFETHIEHNFNGYIMNKIPLLNKLQWNLIGSFHQINIPHYKPYQEFSVGFDNIGFGKLRFLRIDYVRAYQNGFVEDGFMFGLKF